jgi:SAM-dependent methyltransferase
MEAASRHDAWAGGDSYDAFMGRWSRRVAPEFLAWLDRAPGLDWLDVGCGTGALSEAILAGAAPRDLLAVDPSEAFAATARARLHPRADVRVAGAGALPADDASRDAVVAGLVLNFVPDRPGALAEMRRVARPGGTVAFYVWDYPGGGMAFLSAFWRAATALDPAAADLRETGRFPFCTPDGLTALARDAGLAGIEARAIVIPTAFASFEDFWHPFTLGAGPAPGYVAGLDPQARDRLRDRLDADLPRESDGRIVLSARAWALRATAP